MPAAESGAQNDGIKVGIRSVRVSCLEGILQQSGSHITHESKLGRPCSKAGMTPRIHAQPTTR